MDGESLFCPCELQIKVIQLFIRFINRCSTVFCLTRLLYRILMGYPPAKLTDKLFPAESAEPMTLMTSDLSRPKQQNSFR